MRKKKLIAVLLGSLTACALAGVLAGCGGTKDETPSDGTNVDNPKVDKDINYKPGDVIVDEKDVEFTETDRETGYSVKYTEKQIDVKYLAGNASYITLAGKDRTDLKVTGYSGELKELSLKEIEDKVKVSGAPISVSAIADEAFANCATLEKVDLSKQNSSLAFEIGDGAFFNCTKVSSVTFPDKVYVDYNSVGEGAFYNNISLKTVALGEKFTVFGSGVFENCVTLTDITLPSKLTSISRSMFSGCESLQTISLPEGVKSIGSYAFESTALTAIPFASVKDLRYIGASAFENTKITTLNIPDTVTYIGNRAFYDCAELRSVTVPFIGADIATDEPFSYRYGMPAKTPVISGGFDDEEDEKQDIVVNNRSISVTVTDAKTIPANAFAGCDDIKSITLTFTQDGKYKVYNSDGETYTTKTVTVSQTMGERAFYNCASLTDVKIPQVDRIADSAFAGCKALGTYSIPSTVKTLGVSAFRGCTSLSSVTIPSSLTVISESAFRGCTSLSSVTIPETVKEIGSYAFRNSGLTSFNVKFDMTYGYSVLADCTKLQSLNIDKFDGYVRISNGETSYYDYRTIGSLDGLFASDTDLDIERYTESSFPLYLRSGVSFSSAWVPKSLTKVTVQEICVVPSNFAQGVTSVKEISLGMVEELHNYNGNGEYKVAEIRSSAFKNCSSLETLNVTNGDKVKSIGSEAFYGCAKLSDSVLEVFNGVNSIGDFAFQGCTSFRNVTVPASLLREENGSAYNGLGSRIFYNCHGITSLTIEQYSINYYNYNFNGYRTSSIGSISNLFGASKTAGESDYSFENKYTNGIPNTLNSIVLNNVIALENYAFQNMSNITDVEVNFAKPDNYTTYSYSIGNGAFSGCYNLEEVLTDSTDFKVTFGNEVFANCYRLETMDIPVYIQSSTTYGVFANMEYVENYGYRNAPTLNEITLMLPENLDTYYLARLFTNSSTTTYNSGVYSSLEKVHLVATPSTAVDDNGDEIPNTFRIPANMFRDCDYLTDVIFGTDVSSIGSYAFYGCSNLRNRTMPNGTTVRTYRNWVLEHVNNGSNSSSYVLPANAVGVADGALGNSSNPTVYFLGDEEAWENVILPENYSDAKVLYYSKNEPASYGPHWQYNDLSSYENAPVAWKYASQDYTLDANGGYFNGNETQTTLNIKPSEKGNNSYELAKSDLVNPTHEEYFFGGWYTDAKCTQEVSFPYYSETATTLYAKWVPCEISMNNYVTEEDGVYTLTPTRGYANIYLTTSVDITVTFLYKLQGESNYDYLYAYTGSYRGNSIDSGYTDWIEITRTVAAGETLTISYYNDDSSSSQAQIKDIEITLVNSEAAD